MINPDRMDRMGTIHDFRARGPYEKRASAMPRDISFTPNMSKIMPVGDPVKFVPSINGIAPKTLLLIAGAILILFLIFKK